MKKELTTQQKGITTEIFVAARLLELGYNVSQPFCQDSKYDLIVDVNGNIRSVFALKDLIISVLP